MSHAAWYLTCGILRVDQWTTDHFFLVAMGGSLCLLAKKKHWLVASLGKLWLRPLLGWRGNCTPLPVSSACMWGSPVPLNCEFFPSIFSWATLGGQGHLPSAHLLFELFVSLPFLLPQTPWGFWGKLGCGETPFLQNYYVPSKLSSNTVGLGNNRGGLMRGKFLGVPRKQNALFIGMCFLGALHCSRAELHPLMPLGKLLLGTGTWFQSALLTEPRTLILTVKDMMRR